MLPWFQVVCTVVSYFWMESWGKERLDLAIRKTLLNLVVNSLYPVNTSRVSSAVSQRGHSLTEICIPRFNAFLALNRWYTCQGILSEWTWLHMLNRNVMMFKRIILGIQLFNSIHMKCYSIFILLVRKVIRQLMTFALWPHIPSVKERAECNFWSSQNFNPWHKDWSVVQQLSENCTLAFNVTR